MQACHWKAHSFLPKRPCLVRQQQYISGASSSGTTSPRPFPSAYLSSGRKGGGGGTPAGAKSSGVYPRVQVLVTSPDVYGKISYIFNCIMYLVFTSVP